MTLNTENILVGMGNPLLDISADVTPAFLAKYGLEPNNAILAEEKHKPLYDELVKQFKAAFIAGGAAQNSVRCAQWLLPANSVSYFGCVGKDLFADKMRAAATADGVRVLYLEDEAPTGTCAVLVNDNGKHRSLVANLSAANNFKKDHLLKPENWKVIEDAKFYYVSGFFLTVSPESILLMAKHACEKKKTFVMNLSAPFLCQFFKSQMLECLPYVDVLFGNESEALAFAENNDLGTKDLKEIALKIAALSKTDASRPRRVIITQGADPTIVAYEGKISEFPVIPISPEKIVDTNGAGDAFVGGYLSQLVQGKSLESCIKAGNYMANFIIQRSGASLPAEKPSLEF